MTGSRPRRLAIVGKKTVRPGRKSPSSPRRRRFPGGWRSRLILASSLVILGLFAWAVAARQLAPVSNTSLTHFDAIIVLGAPATTDGDPSPLQLARVTEAVAEYERGVAPRLILTGGPDGHRPVEADVMARIAEAQGIPESAIIEERTARDTIQNGCYSVRIMQDQGWHSAEVVSSASHLPRAGLIFNELPLEWRTHAAPGVEPESADSKSDAVMETLKTLRYLVWARQMERCGPRQGKM